MNEKSNIRKKCFENNVTKMPLKQNKSIVPNTGNDL